MILPIIVVVVLVIAGAIAFVVMSKSSRTSGEFLVADATRPATPLVRPDTPASAEPVASAPEPEGDLGTDLDLGRLVSAEPALVEPVAVVSEPVAVAPAPASESEPPAEDRPEPMVRARIASGAPAPTPASEPVALDDDDDQAVLSRFKSPGARVASIPIPPPTEAQPAPSGDPEPAQETATVAPVGAIDAEPVAMPEPQPEPVSVPEPVAIVEPESAFVPEPVAIVEPESESEVDSEVEPPAEPVVTAGVDDDVVVATSGDADDEVPVAADAPPALTGAAAMSPVLEDPIVLTDEPVPPVARLQPEPERDPVDHVLKALIDRAKEKQVGIAEVAAELVEQANLEDRDIDEVLADLVVRADDDTVDSSERLEELTLFNDSVPRRPGQLTDFDRLDKNARKKVIIRVLCLLVAMQEDNRLKPSEPRSEAETRHWPLARAVWPVPVADAEDGADDGEGDKKLPGRRLARSSTKR